MPYCPNCGEEIKEGTVFCPSCGAQIRQMEGRVDYRKPRGRDWTWILAIVIGGMIFLAGFGLLVGGTGIMWAQRNLSDEEGFLTSNTFNVNSGRYAVVFKGADIQMDVNLPRSVWQQRPLDWVTVKVIGESDVGKPVFIGIAESGSASDYLSRVGYDEVIEFDWDWSPSHRTAPKISYLPHSGSAPDLPDTKNWVASVSGTGKRTLVWDAESGSYWIVFMNADGSKDVDVDVEIAINIPFLRTIARGLVGSGIVVLLIGGVIIYYGGLRRR